MTLHLRVLTVGAWQEKCYLLVSTGTNGGLLVDPGGETDRILARVEGFSSLSIPTNRARAACHVDIPKDQSKMKALGLKDATS